MLARTTTQLRRSVQVVSIFLSSPGDVAEERRLARELIDTELSKRPPFRERVKLEVIAWDDPAARIPMLATETPQASVNAARPRPATCDIVIVILWSRMGTPLPESVRKPNGEPYLSGTEWEYEDAVNAPQKPPPQVLLYRRTEEPMIGMRDPQKKEKEEQFERVEAFFAQFRSADGSLKGGVNEYTRAADFKPLLRQHLEEILHRLLPEPPADPNESPIAAVVPPEYRDWLQGAWADVSFLGQEMRKGHAVTLSHVYVPALTRAEPQAEKPKRSRKKQVKDAEEQKPIPLIGHLDRESLYVPAPAGAGKSTFCRWAALQSISGVALSHPVPAPEEFVEPTPADLRCRLPLLVVLREFWRRMDCGRGERTWRRIDLEKALSASIDVSPPPGLSGALLKAHLNAGSAFLLLDGLDEVPPSENREGVTVYPRELLLSGLVDALPAWRKAGNRILLTGRPYGLDEAGLHRLGLASAPLEPLPDPLQDLFVSRWFHTLGKTDVIPELIATIRNRDELAPLIENPMLLTAMCILYDSGGHLPEDRYDLYKRIVDNVLTHRYPGDARDREPVKARLEAIAYGMHVGEDEMPRQTPAAEIGYAETERHLAKFAACNPAFESGRVQPTIQREELLTRSGLLLPRDNSKVEFYHMSFQEFLASERIAQTSDDTRTVEQVFRDRGSVPEWRPTLLYLFSGQIFNYRNAQWGLDLLGRLIADQDREAVTANPARAIFIAEALELCLAKGYRIPPDLTDAFGRLSLDAIADEVALPARQTLGLALGRLGDPRILSLRDLKAYVEVPAGTYSYGEEGQTIEIPAPFRIGKYPVTNSQYAEFIEAGGYRDEGRQWWSEAGWAWRQEERQEEEFTEPRWWRDRRWNGPNQTVVGVSFWEAEACCAWAGGRLPTEREWEAAARGRDGFIYPWGNDWQDGICNSVEAGLGVTSAVGLFPRSRQAALGIEDLVGNAWEWCDSLYDPNDKQWANARVLRGGSFVDRSWYLRASVRDGYVPEDRDWFGGFRCVHAPPRQP